MLVSAHHAYNYGGGNLGGGSLQEGCPAASTRQTDTADFFRNYVRPRGQEIDRHPILVTYYAGQGRSQKGAIFFNQKFATTDGQSLLSSNHLLIQSQLNSYSWGYLSGVVICKLQQFKLWSKVSDRKCNKSASLLYSVRVQLNSCDERDKAIHRLNC